MSKPTEEQYKEAISKIEILRNLESKTGDRPVSLDKWLDIVNDYNKPDVCPFCQERKVEVRTDRNSPILNKGYYVQCLNCLASGPYGKDAREAIDLWERRNREEIVDCVG